MRGACLAAVLAMASCSVKLELAGGYLCNDGQTCPEGLECRDGLCLPPASDAGPPDAPGMDAAPPGPCIADITAGHQHTCILTGAGEVWCWGRDDFAQLGDDSGLSRAVAVQVGGLTGVTRISAGGQYTCALTDVGGVWCWGSNTAGQLGTGMSSDHEAMPVAVSGLPPVVEIATGSRHACGRTGAGDVWCWGCQVYNDWYECMTDDATPAMVGGLSGIAGLAIARKHTWARRADGSYAAWGRNDYGQLGDQTTMDQAGPVDVTILDDIQSVVGGRYHSCAIRADGSVWCWANNEAGQLGRGTETPVEATAAAVQGVQGAVSLVAGGWYTCALSGGGEVFCWGEGNDGELGDGVLVNQDTAAAVPGLTGVTALAGGGYHVCAVNGEGVWCWGDNSAGAAGGGYTSDLEQPTLVYSCPVVP